MIKKFYLFLTLTALLWLGSGNAWGAQSLPYSYGFETDLQVAGWTKSNPSGKNNSKFGIHTSAKQNGTYGFRFSSYDTGGANTQYLISPEFDAPYGFEFSFSYKVYSSSTSGETFKVGYSTTDANTESFTWGEEVLAMSTDWDTYVSDCPAGTKYIAIYYYADYQYYLYVDDWSFEALSPCAKPADLATSEIETNSAKFTWTAGTGVGEYQYLCLPAVEEPDWSSASVKSTTASTVTVDGLGASTSYKFYVRANCGGTDGVSSVASVAFKTACGAISTLPKTWNFDDMEDNSFPECWNCIYTGSNAPRVYNYSYYAKSTPKSLYAYGGGSSSPVVLVLPPFEAPTNSLVLSFYYRCSEDNPSWGYEYGHVYIGYITDPSDASTFVALSSALDQEFDSHLFVDKFSLAGAPDNAYIAIKYAGSSASYGGSLYIDDVMVGLPPTCLQPTGLAAVANGSDGGNVSWNDGGKTAWVLQYQANGGSWSDDIDVNGTPSYALLGLTPNTIYNVRVKANCGTDGESEWSTTASFRTECGAETTFPWTNTFDALAQEIIPECWNNSGSTCTLAWAGTEYYIWGTYKSGSNTMLRLNSSFLNADGSALINTPQIALPNETDYEFVFDYSHKASCGAFKVKISVNGGSFEEIGSYTNDGGTQTYPGDFTTISLSLADYANKTVQFQFYAEPDYGNGAIFIDNIIVRKAPTCVVPTGLTISNISSSTANLSWTAGKNETAWIVEYKADGAADWTEKAVSTTPSCTLTGLAASTTYYVQVKADCGAGDYSESCAQQTFKTTCAAESLPFVEDFGSTSVIPDCWTVGKTGGSYQWTPTYDTYPNYYLYFRTGYGSTYSYLTLPAIELTEDAQLTFDWRNSNNVTADLLISTDGGTTFTPIPNHGLSTTASSWTAKKYDLSAYTGETVIISIRGYNGTSSRYLRIDNIRVDAKPCEALAAPTAAPTIDGGTISWTGNAKALRYQAVGASTWNTVAVTTTSYLLTGLEASTSYNVQVQTACATGDDDLWSNSLTFTTRCAATDELPYSNNFDTEESEEMPACWSKISTTEYPYVYSGAAAYGGSGKALYFYGSAEQIAVLPALTADLSTLTFSLYYKGGSANFQLGYVKADGVTFVALEPLPALSAFGAEPYELDLASIPAEAKYLAIRYSSTSNYATGFVDNVVVKKTPTCFKPASIAASAITANSATVAWTASGKGETQYQYVCVPAGETPDWTAATLTDELSATLTTLAPTTEYDFYVRSYCGTEDQSDAVKTSFTTKCAAAALPFDEDFDAVADYDMPECWNVYAATYYAAYVANGQLHADAPKTNATVIVLPELEASFVGASVSFNYSTSNGTLQVGYVTDAEDKNSFVAVSEALTAASTTQVLVPFTAGSGNIAFRFIGNTGDGDLYLDNVRVSTTLVLANDADNTAALAANEGQTLDVQIGRTFFKGVGNNTICLPFSLPTLDGTPLEGGTLLAFKYGYVENGELLLRVYPAESMEAGVPYLISWEAGDNIVNPVFKSVTISAAQGKSVGENNDVQFVGIFAPETFPQYDKTKLFMLTNDQIAWSGVEASEANSLKSFRAYFQTNTAVGSNSGSAPIRHGMPARIVKQENSATGFENVQFDAQTLKLIENGNVVIIRNGVKYNLQGQVISK